MRWKIQLKNKRESIFLKLLSDCSTTRANIYRIEIKIYYVRTGGIKMCAQFRLCCPNGVSATTGQQDKTTESTFKIEIFDLNDSILGFDVNASDLLFYWSFSQRITSITVTLFWTSFKFNICKSAFLFFLYSSIRFLNDSLELVNNPGEWIFFHAYEISELNNTRNALHSGGLLISAHVVKVYKLQKKTSSSWEWHAKVWLAYI